MTNVQIIKIKSKGMIFNCLVDDIYYSYLSSFNWCVQKGNLITISIPT